MNEEEEEKYPVPDREQKSPKMELDNESAAKCLCPGCPTYESDSCPGEKEEKIYCSIGMADCDLEQKGCVCGNCPVFKEDDLKAGYFCAKGEADQTGKPVASESAD